MESKPNRSSNLHRHATTLLNLAVALGAMLIFPWNPLALPAAQFLIDTDQPAKADVIYLLGGDWLGRGPVAAHLFENGYAPIIVFDKLAVAETKDTFDVLIEQGVPRECILDFDNGRPAKSTADEARALRGYVNAKQVKKLLVVTSVLHSRRARMAMNLALICTGIQVRFVCSGATHFSGTDWQDVKLEWTKLLFYFFAFYG